MRQSVKTGILSAAVLVSVTLAALAQAPSPNAQDPKYQSKGEQDRTYTFPGTTEMIPYHIYVPMKWDKNTKLPLVIVTHGASQPATAPFMRPTTNPTLAKTAEERGYIVAAVTGYHANATVWTAATGDGGWNNPYKMVGAAPRGGGGGGRGAGAACRGEHPPVALAEVVELQPQPAEAAGVVEAAEAEVVQQPRPQHRRIFSAPSRICFMSPI